MADQTKPRFNVEHESGEVIELEASQQIWRGEIVNVITAATNRGQAAKGGDDSNRVFGGIALTDAEDGDKVRISLSGIGNFVAIVNLASTSPGTAIYIEDSQSVDLVGNTTNDVKIGVLVKGAAASSLCRVAYKSGLLG